MRMELLIRSLLRVSLAGFECILQRRTIRSVLILSFYISEVVSSLEFLWSESSDKCVILTKTAYLLHIINKMWQIVVLC
jgi:hypothetical protein